MPEFHESALQALLSSRYAAEALREADAGITAQRAALISERRKLEAECEKRGPGAFALREAAFRDADVALRHGVLAFAEANERMLAANREADEIAEMNRRIEGINVRLRASASPLLTGHNIDFPRFSQVPGGFLQELREAWWTTKASPAWASSKERRMAAIRALETQVERELVVGEADQTEANLKPRIERMRQSLPAVEMFAGRGHA